MTGAILVVNAGSSSIKFAVYRADSTQRLDLAACGQLEGIGTHPHFSARDTAGTSIADRPLAADEAAHHKGAMAIVGAWLRDYLDGTHPIAVGHRVVHGGPDYSGPVRIDDAVLQALERLVPLAPLHQPHNLAAVRALAEGAPDLPQVACFDTAFHRGHPLVADLFALPHELYQAGIRRYGFHGLSYEYIARSLPAVAPEIASGRVVVAHLGNGTSLCALKAGCSMDSSMSFTALDGLPMGTRTGALDPGVLLYLLEARGMTAKQLQTLLYTQSGLLGLSGLSSDMRDLLASAEPRARLAVDYFVHRIVRETGAMAAVLGGLDALVFTAGIGEHAPEIRARVCEGLTWLGVGLDPAANARGGPCISADGSRASAWVIPTDEERMIALHTLETLGAMH